MTIKVEATQPVQPVQPAQKPAKQPDNQQPATSSLLMKIDAGKARLFISGNVDGIKQYLELQEYNSVQKSFTAANAKINQRRNELQEQVAFQKDMLHAMEFADNPSILDFIKTYTEDLAKLEDESKKQASSYSVTLYNLAWNELEDGSIVVEFWFPVKEHYTDTKLNDALGALIQPLNLPAAKPEQPNMRVEDLKPREYVTILPKIRTSSDLALEVVKNFEQMAKTIRQQAKLTETKIPSSINITCDGYSRYLMSASPNNPA